MKRSILFAALLLLMIFVMTGPAQAGTPDDYNTVLAQGAAKGVLLSLQRPDLAGLANFYLTDTLQSTNPLNGLTGVTGYQITGESWLNEAVYRVNANLQPGNRAVMLDVGQHDNRWLVENIELAPVAAPLVSAAVVAVASGPAPIASNGAGKIIFQTQSGGEIYLINADGTGLQYVTAGLDPQLSPDGTKIAFTRWEPRYELFTINLDGTGEQAWTQGWRQMKSPTWSADGAKIIFSYQDGGRLDAENISINLQNAAMQGEQPRIPAECVGVKLEGKYIKCTLPADALWRLKQIDLTTREMSDLATELHSYGPTAHPTDPNQVAYKGEKGIAINNVAISRDQLVTTDQRDHTPIISPNGTKIAVSYWQDGHWEIHTMNLDGAGRVRLTETPLWVLADNTILKSEFIAGKERIVASQNPHWNNAAPVWSPDGSQLAFVTDRSGPWEFWIMNADGSNPRPMFSNGALNGLTLTYAGVDERMLSWRLGP